MMRANDPDSGRANDEATRCPMLLAGTIAALLAAALTAGTLL